jgi:hypothetical protein
MNGDVWNGQFSEEQIQGLLRDRFQKQSNLPLERGSVEWYDTTTTGGTNDGYTIWTDTTTGTWPQVSVTSITENPNPFERILWENSRWRIGKLKQNGEVGLEKCVYENWVTITSELIMMNMIWDSKPPKEYTRVPKHILKKYATFTKIKRML